MPDRLILHLCLIRRRRRRLNTIIRVNKCLERRDLGRGKFGILKNDVGKSSVYPSVGWRMSRQFWILWVIAAPVTLLVLITWFCWIQGVQVRKRMEMWLRRERWKRVERGKEGEV